MSSVLRKKIEAGAGIPPTILQYQEFWDLLQVKVSAWAFDTLAIETKGLPETRKVVPGNVAQAQFEGLQSLVFNSKVSPGLCALGIDEAGAALNAGQRLKQDGGSVAGVSSLFLKLLFEAPGLGLWRSLAGSLPGHLPAGGHAPLADYSQAAGHFDPTQRYLIVGFNIVQNELRVRLWLVFHIDYVLQHAVLSRDEESGRRSQGSGQGQNSLRASVRASTILLDGVLDELEMTVGDCTRLEVGQILPLSEADTARITLQAETVNGTVAIGHAEMGVWKQQRALKLNTPILEPFTRELAKL